MTMRGHFPFLRNRFVPAWIGLLLGLASQGAGAQAPAALEIAALSAACANCHGTQGRPAAGASLPPLAGMRAEEMLTQLRAFRSGERPSTIMQQLARGYTEAQLAQIAGYFAGQAR